MDKKLPLSLQVVFYFLATFLFLYFLFIARDILIPLAFGTFFALILYPLCTKLESWGIPRILSIAICLIIVIIIFGGLIYIIAEQFISLSQDIPDLTTKIQTKFNEWEAQAADLLPAESTSILEDSLNGLLEKGSAIVTSTLSSAAGIISMVLLVPVYVFLLLLYRTQLKAFFFRIAPQNRKGEVNDILKKIQHVIQNYISGLGTVMLIIAILNSIGLMALGIEYAVFLGVFAAMLTIIPYLGVILGALPAVLVALLTKEPALAYAVGVIAIFAVVQFMEGNFLTPKIIGSSVSINPLAAIVALFVGAKVWGPAGMILVIPGVAILKIFLEAFESTRPFSVLLGNTAPMERNENHPEE